MQGRLKSFDEGYHSQGAFFYVADYGLLIDYEKIDGVVLVTMVQKYLASNGEGGVIGDWDRVLGMMRRQQEDEDVKKAT